MNADSESLSRMTAYYFSSIRSSAKDLYSISAKLQWLVTEVNQALKSVNVGIEIWVPVRSNAGTREPSAQPQLELGYARVDQEWCLSIRRAQPESQRPGSKEEIECWPCIKAPLDLRIQALNEIPALFRKLSSEAAKIVDEVRNRLMEVQAIAEAVNNSSAPQNSPIAVSGPVRCKLDAELDSAELQISSARSAVLSFLGQGGFDSAAQYLRSARWTQKHGSLHIDEPETGLVSGSLIEREWTYAPEPELSKSLVVQQTPGAA